MTIHPKMISHLYRVLEDESKYTDYDRQVVERLTNGRVTPEITSDEAGNEKWNFTVVNKNYGVLSCSFCPDIAARTMFRYLKKQYLTSTWNTPTLTDEEANTVDVDKTIAHSLTQREHDYAMTVLQEILPVVLCRALSIAGQKALHRQVWDLDGKTHRILDKKHRPKHAAAQITKAAKRLVEEDLRLPGKGRSLKQRSNAMPQYTKAEIERKMTRYIFSAKENALLKDAATALNFPYREALRSKLQTLGENRTWKRIVEETWETGEYKIPA